ncbi:MAG TPA: hypothetical protein VG073_04660 [Gaiellaceae bacterium]|jgi:hypothetical protein|nr:hypothetical protein [Gaiellaceae bacterium]
MPSLLAHLPSRPSRGELRLAGKMGAAGTLAWWLSTLLGADRPLFAVLDSQILPPPIDPATLRDPRAVGLAIKLRQMVEHLAAA